MIKFAVLSDCKGQTNCQSGYDGKCSGSVYSILQYLMKNMRQMGTMHAATSE